MDFSKIFIKGACPTKIGGQAILEGIMMKGPDRTAVVVRKPDGRMHIKVEPLKSPGPWKKIPIVRGVIAFVEALITGTQTLMYSAEVLESCEEEESQAADGEKGLQEESREKIGEGNSNEEPQTRAEGIHSNEESQVRVEGIHSNEEPQTGNEGIHLKEGLQNRGEGNSNEESQVRSEGIHSNEESRAGDGEKKSKKETKEKEEGGLSAWMEKHLGEKVAFNIMLYFSVTLAIVFTVGIFVVAPTAVINLFRHIIPGKVTLNLMEGVLRILLFVGYIAVISRMPDIRRVFEFHGAEHKTIHCYENNLPLTPANCQTFETLHPRCGTSFLMFVMIISLLLFSLLGWPNLVIRIVSRILLIPVIAGLSYELLQWAGKSDSLLVKILSYPGLLLQKLTTKRPDDSQLEVAIAAMRAVLAQDPPALFIGETDTEGNLYPEEEK